MRPIFPIAIALILAVPLSVPAVAAEPDAPNALVTQPDAIRALVQNRLSEKFTAPRSAGRTSLAPWWSITRSLRTSFFGSMSTA
jgi:hypothetical protein